MTILSTTVITAVTALFNAPHTYMWKVNSPMGFSAQLQNFIKVVCKLAAYNLFTLTTFYIILEKKQMGIDHILPYYTLVTYKF